MRIMNEMEINQIQATMNQFYCVSPVGDSTVAVKCVLEVKFILPKNKMQNERKMTLSLVVVSESFLSK